MIKEYEIWSEGYRCTGQEADATFHGRIKANTFREACDKLFFEKEKNDVRKDYNSKSLTYWGCRLFDNESDARRSFG